MTTHDGTGPGNRHFPTKFRIFETLNRTMQRYKLQLSHLTKRKLEIEADIASQKAILDANGVGMNEPLIDNEGFPRADIDVYKVRHARHRIICLLNDHKTLMKDIEQALHAFHANLPRNGNSPSSPAHEGPPNDAAVDVVMPIRTFAVVKDVEIGSPADIAGLRTGDGLVKFGSVNAGNFQGVDEIATVVRHSVGKPINVVAFRGASSVPVILTPTQWAGKGLLGCSIHPA
ncbi:unnamed protein product [Ixodes persulcatus]